MKCLHLEEQEQQALLNLIDIAVKAGGLNVAENAVFLAKKIQAAEEVETPDE